MVQNSARHNDRERKRRALFCGIRWAASWCYGRYGSGLMSHLRSPSGNPLGNHGVERLDP